MEVEDIRLARPRRIKYGNGEISLMGYSPEEADAIETKLQEVRTELVEGPKTGDIVDLKEITLEALDTTTLSETAVDLYLNPDTKEYQLVHVKYNPLSKSAKVAAFLPAGSFRLAGTNTFKMELVKLGKI